MKLILGKHCSVANMLFHGRSLEETYEALRTFQILGLDKGADTSHATCPLVLESLSSSSSSLKEIFDALRVNSILHCKPDANIIKVSFSRCEDHFFVLIFRVANCK